MRSRRNESEHDGARADRGECEALEADISLVPDRQPHGKHRGIQDRCSEQHHRRGAHVRADRPLQESRSTNAIIWLSKIVPTPIVIEPILTAAIRVIRSGSGKVAALMVDPATPDGIASDLHAEASEGEP